MELPFILSVLLSLASPLKSNGSWILTVDLHAPFVLDEATSQKWSLRSTSHNPSVILDRRGQVQLRNGAVRFIRHLRFQETIQLRIIRNYSKSDCKKEFRYTNNRFFLCSNHICSPMLSKSEIYLYMLYPEDLVAFSIVTARFYRNGQAQNI